MTAATALPTWVVVADEEIARLLVHQPDGELREVDTLTAAAPSTGAADAGTASRTLAVLQDEASELAARVAARLASAQRELRLGEVMLAAPPAFLGRLTGALAPEVAMQVRVTLAADVVRCSLPDLAQRLGPHLGAAGMR